MTSMRTSPNLRGTPTMESAANARAQQQLRGIATGPVAILWDIENCPVPGEVNAKDVAGNIRMALQVHPSFRGAVTMFSAYGDFNHFPRKVREGCQRTGVNLIDVPNGRKDAADKAILVDMFLFALDNPPPSTIFLITGDVDFAPALHKLGQRGYTVVLGIPDRVWVSSALCGAGRFVWDWPSVARGEGLVPAKAVLGRGANLYPSEGQVPVELNTHSDLGQGHWVVSDESELPSENVSYDDILNPWRLTHLNSTLNAESGKSDVHSESVDFLQQFGSAQVQTHVPRPSQESVMSSRTGPLSQKNHGIGLTCKVGFSAPKSGEYVTQTGQVETQSGQAGILGEWTEPSSPGGLSHTSWVQPGDLPGLKRQFVKLLSLNGGKMSLVRVPSEYCKQFGRPLYLAEYGSLKLVHLIEKMRDLLCVKGDGTTKTLSLTKAGARVARKYKPVANQGEAPKGDKERDVCEDSEPEGMGTTVKEMEKEASKVETIVSVASQRHLLDMDMDEVTGETLLVQEWDSGSGEKKGSQMQSHEERLVEALVQVKYVEEGKLEVFRQELQELLVSHACSILLTSFLALYQQRYARDLDLSSFGVKSLECLLEKVKDVAVMKEEPGTSRMFVVAV